MPFGHLRESHLDKYPSQLRQEEVVEEQTHHYAAIVVFVRLNVENLARAEVRVHHVTQLQQGQPTCVKRKKEPCSSVWMPSANAFLLRRGDVHLRGKHRKAHVYEEAGGEHGVVADADVVEEDGARQAELKTIRTSLLEH